MGEEAVSATTYLIVYPSLAACNTPALTPEGKVTAFVDARPVRSVSTPRV